MKKIALLILCISLALNAGPLHDAAAKGDNQAIQNLISQGASVDLKGNNGLTALMEAAYRGHTETARLLLTHKASVDMQDNDGRTALMFAASQGHTETAKMLLLSHNASVDMQSGNGMTALIRAVRNGRTETARLLLSYNASVDMQDNNGRTALMEAASAGRTETARLLLSYNASVDMQDNNGRTALIAACGGHTESVKLLLDAGANPFIREKENQNAIQRARFARDIPSSIFITGRQNYLCNKRKQLDDEKERRLYCLCRMKELNPEAALYCLPPEILYLIAGYTLEKGYKQLARDQQEWNECTAQIE